MFIYVLLSMFNEETIELFRRAASKSGQVRNFYGKEKINITNGDLSLSAFVERGQGHWDERMFI